MPADSRRVKELFASALDVPDPTERAAFLDRECGGDDVLRRRLDVLLAAHDRPDAALKQPFAAPSAVDDTATRSLRLNAEPAPDPAAVIGAVVAGRYKLLEQIGEGGMGTVWMAEQREPVKRLVAVKVIKPGMDSRAVLARFEAERQALALMDHPNIARVLDGGTTSEGRPYFVMELVKGLPLTEYCDARRMNVRDRLDLFGQVCSAVQHAHQKGVIHRDLKPSNILITEHDGKPVPKVIDFGLAKALAATNVLTDKTLHTAFGAVVGTPLYMAPEQVGINALDVDTRTDVYALGVILYELLTGSTPLEKKRLRDAAWEEMRRLIREEEPPRPSTRLSSSATLPSLAAGRQIEPARLAKLVRGELDWIVMKALEKDRNRRYETANGLAMDVRRHLAGEPVLAVPPTLGYRFRKFARRNRGPVTAAAAVLLAVVVGAGVATWQAVRATRAEIAALTERDDKEQARQAEADQRATAVAHKERAEKAEEQARQEAAVSRAVRDFLQADLLQQADLVAQAETARLTGGGFETKVNPTVRELLNRAAAGLTPDKIGTKFPGQPRAQAEILNTIGRTYAGIGEYGQAIEHLTRAVTLYRTTLGPDDPTTLTARQDLAEAYANTNRTSDAVAQFEAVRDARMARLGPDHRDVLTTQAELGLGYAYTGKMAEGIALLEQVCETSNRKLGREDPATLRARVYLAAAYNATNRSADAITLTEETLSRAMTVYAPDHPHMLSGRVILAQFYQADGRHADAVKLLDQARVLVTTKYSPNHALTLLVVNRLSLSYRAIGQLDKALPLLHQTLEGVRRQNGPLHASTLQAVQSLVISLAECGRYAEAAATSREQADRVREKDGDKSITYAQSLTYLGRVYMWQPGVPNGAEAVIREALAIRRATGDKESGDYSGDLSNLGLLLLRQGKYDEAESVLRECLAIREKKAPNGWTRYNTTSMLGGSLLGQGNHAEAEPLLRTGYEGMKASLKGVSPVDNPRYIEAADRLIELYTATNKPDEVKKYQAERAKYNLEKAPAPRAVTR